MNQVQLVGNITRDPEYRTLQSGVTCCQFTVACQRRFKNANGGYGQPSPPPAQTQPQQRNEQQRMDLASQGFQEVDDDDELPF